MAAIVPHFDKGYYYNEQGYWAGFHNGNWQGFQKGFTKGVEKGFHKGHLKGFEKGFTKGVEKGFPSVNWKGFHKGVEKGSDTHSQGQGRIPIANASMIDLTGGEGKGKARNRDRSRSRNAKGKGEVGVDSVKEALEELGYEYCVTRTVWARTPPDMTESDLEALRAKVLETRSLRS